MSDPIARRVDSGVDAWLRWLPSWTPSTQRARARMCRRCLGSPILAAAGVSGEVPHQVGHALTSRMQRIIDRAVDEVTEQELPTLRAELADEELWNAGGFDPAAGLAPEYDGIDLDPTPEADQPFLFTLAELAEESRPGSPLPRPPLSPDEKSRLREEIARADEVAARVGADVCRALVGHRLRIRAALDRFVEPQIADLLRDLSEHLEPPQ